MDITYTVTGFVIGAIIGLTGIGGGSLMTPALILYGIPPVTAVGTDLLYASITKCGGVWAHQREGNINWRVVGLMALGSMPTAVLMVWLLHSLQVRDAAYQTIITAVLGVSLILTSLVLLFSTRLRQYARKARGTVLAGIHKRWAGRVTVLGGVTLGVLVTLSSVGAGALGTAMLVVLYPRLAAARIVGIDLAHAVPLTAIAGFGHLWIGTVDLQLLIALLIGSLPGVALGTRMGSILPDQLMRGVLGCMLMAIGVGFAVQLR